MKEICPVAKCTGCGACVQICPQKCISMERDREGFLRPRIDEETCVNCGNCARSCPSNEGPPRNGEAVFYMAWHRDREVLERSSSGGAFTALAEFVLSRGGVVIGAELIEETREVVHTSLERMDELDRLRLSKYYQSDTRNIYAEVKGYLERERWGYFSPVRAVRWRGCTPCWAACETASFWSRRRYSVTALRAKWWWMRTSAARNANIKRK